MMDVDNDTAVLFDGKVETVEYQPTAYNDGILWHQQQEVVNIEVKPVIKTEDGTMFGSCGGLDMLATVATDPSYTRMRIKTEASELPVSAPAPPPASGSTRGGSRVGRIAKLTEQDRIGYSQLSKMSLNTLLRLFTETSYDSEGKRINRYICCLMSPDDHFGRTSFISFSPCEFEVRTHGLTEAKAKTQMKVHLQQHVKDILNCGDHEQFSAEPVAAKLRRMARVKREWPEHHFLVPKTERFDPPMVTEDHHYFPSHNVKSEPAVVTVTVPPTGLSPISHDHSYAYDSNSISIKSMPMEDQIHVPEFEEGSYELHLPSCDSDDDEAANDSGAGSGEGSADENKYNGFVGTGDPVINLDVRCSVNEIPTVQEPKGFVPLIGSEVDIKDARSSPIPSTSKSDLKKKPRGSPTSPTNSSDSGLSVSGELDAASLEKLQEQSAAQQAIKELKSRGSSTDDLACRICQPARNFTAYTSLLTHLQSHAGTKKFKCHVCKMSFGRQQILNYHMSVHLDQKKFVCPECGRTFRHPYYYKSHLRTHECNESVAQHSKEPFRIIKPFSPSHSVVQSQMLVPSDELMPRVLLGNTEEGTDVQSTALAKENETPSSTTTSQQPQQQQQLSQPIPVPTTTVHNERTTPQLTTSLVKINMRSAKLPSEVIKKRKPVKETVKIWQQTVEVAASGGSSTTYVPLSSPEGDDTNCKIFKDVSNVTTSTGVAATAAAAPPPLIHPKAILATMNGRQVLLIPKTAGTLSATSGRPSAPSQPDLQQQKSKLEQALRFGSASVESSNDYVAAESDQRPRSSSAESSDEPSSSEGANAEALSSS